MSEQKRLLLAVVASVAIMLGWQFVVAKFFPHLAAPQKTVAISAAKNTPSSSSLSSVGSAPVTSVASTVLPSSREPVTDTLVDLSSNLFHASIHSTDGSLAAFELKNYTEAVDTKSDKKPVSLVNASVQGEKRQSLLRLSLDGVPLTGFQVVQQKPNEVILQALGALPVRLSIIQRPDSYALDYVVDILNASQVPHRLEAAWAFALHKPATTSSGFLSPPSDQLGGICGNAENVERKAYKDLKQPFKSDHAQWFGLDRQYFVLAGFSDLPGLCEMKAVDDRLEMSTLYPAQTIEPGAQFKRQFTMYAGPKKAKTLEAVHSSLGQVIDYTVMYIPMGFAAKPMVWVLEAFHALTSSWGLAIILLTVLVKLLLFPVTYKSSVSMRKMQLLKPELDRIKKQFENDKEKQQLEQLKLFREKGVNPLGGCLPMLLQMPVWFALYRMLWSAVDLYQQPFLWIPNLTAKEPLPIMALTLGALTFVQQKLTPTGDNDQAKVMMIVMPVMLTVFMLALPSGLVLYVLANTILTIAQQMIINKRTATL